MNLFKRLLSRRQPATPEERARDMLKAIDAGGIPLNPALVNDIARKLGLDVSTTAPMDETVARMRMAIGANDSATVAQGVAGAVNPGDD